MATVYGYIAGHGWREASNVFGTISSDLTKYSDYYAWRTHTELSYGRQWLAYGTSGYWQLDIGSGRSAIVKKYSIQAGPNNPSSVNRIPNTWTLKGSNNESDWDTLDTVSSEGGWSVNETREYTCDTSTTAYRYFRLDITANNGDATYMEVEEIWLTTQFTTIIDSGWGSNLFTDTDAISTLSEYSTTFKDDYAVDANDTTRWSSVRDQNQSWLQYDLGSGNDAAVQKINLKGISASGSSIGFFMFWGSTDNSTWKLLFSGIHPDTIDKLTYTFENLTAYRYYRLEMACYRGAFGECSVNTWEAYAQAPSGWTGKINGVSSPAKINGIAVANIHSINGVE